MAILWYIALGITHFVAYLWGYSNGEDQMDAQDQLELKKYSYDKFYEHERWKEERKANDDKQLHA